jgi:hypothetical protein
VCLRGLYLIEDRCLLDDFGLVSKRPWEPNLTLVPRITQRQMGRPEMNKPNLGGYVVYVRDGPTKALGRILATGRICI